MLRFLGPLLLASAACAILPGAARADVRTAHIGDGVDKTLVYDLAAVDVRLDRTAGALHVAVRFQRPIPAVFNDAGYMLDGVTVSIDGPPLLNDCRYGSITRGRTWITFGPDMKAPTQDVPEIHSAEARVSYRQDATPVPIVVSPDRMTVTADLQDDLIKHADLQCVSVSSFGRAVYDPSQPNGGPASETGLATYFKGFSPAAKRRVGLGRCAKRYPGKHRAHLRAACRQRVLARYPRR